MCRKILLFFYLLFIVFWNTSINYFGVNPYWLWDQVSRYEWNWTTMQFEYESFIGTDGAPD